MKAESKFRAVPDLMKPSERIGKSMVLWVMVSFPILWCVHTLLVGLMNIIGTHLDVSYYVISLLYSASFIISTRDFYTSISRYTKNRNTLLGYIYGLGLALTNIGLWAMAIKLSAPSLTLFIMLLLGLASGFFIEKHMVTTPFSEEDEEYLTKTIVRTFAVEETNRAIELIEQGEYGQLQFLNSRYEESCCRIQIVYDQRCQNMIVNISIEEPIQLQFGKTIFEFPFTKATTVYSQKETTASFINKENVKKDGVA